MLLIGGIVIFVLPVLSVTLYVLICHKKEYRILKLISEISENPSEDAKISAADQVIILTHKNKWLTVPTVTPININNPRGIKVGFYILESEIKYLVNALDRRRNQKTYLQTITPTARSEMLKFIANARKTLEEIRNDSQAPMRFKIFLLHQIYLTVVTVYMRFPDEEHYRELNFIPIFQLVDRNPIRTVVLFPLFLHQSA